MRGDESLVALACWVAGALAIGCGTNATHAQPRAPSGGAEARQPTAPEDASAKPKRDTPRVPTPCFAGRPAHQRDFGDTQVLTREGFELEHSSALKIPLWVCEHLRRDQLRQTRARRSVRVDGRTRVVVRFRADPDLARGQRAELSDYKRSGFDRGHLAPAADFGWSKRALEQSFYLSNVAPQVGDGFNRHIWKGLEEAVRGYADRYGQAWVISGGLVRGGERRTIGRGQVSVPSHFFKVVVVKHDAEMRVAVVVMGNERYDNTKDFQRFVVSVDQLEQWSGLDFMPELEDSVQDALERRVAELAEW